MKAVEHPEAYPQQRPMKYFLEAGHSGPSFRTAEYHLAK